MAHHLFLASTPFNTLIASMIALDLPSGDTCELWLIDQPPEGEWTIYPGQLQYPESDLYGLD